ncbi:hypothetical protein A5724_22030 [Mycobacterium sp. ACS1612]|uniref:DUF732 domain-containing protein n=1 Tax=Mycobacterium sp. ACS1612 TaxID=1834117 RepID=UPI0007FD63B5|nr:DUF732 domain-containing protein [Mycobacterium sp. ACS1612]OBF31241.1 hypothetical protein A5724_22030 [Mycobacterium sp. ACS1612]
MALTRRNITRLVSIVLAVAALGLTTPGGAAADATDDAFLHKLFDDAVDFGGRDLTVKKAREICDDLRAGKSPADVHDTIINGSTSREGSAFSPRQAAIFMADAVQAYCPEKANLFIRYGQQ